MALLSSWALCAADAPVMHEVPLLECSGLPCVDMATGSGKTLRLLIDTGNPNAYINRQSVEAMGLEKKPMVGTNGQPIAEMEQTVVPGAKLGEAPMGDFPFTILDPAEPGEPGKKVQPLPGDGALTYGSFKDRIVQLDFRRHVLRISDHLNDSQPCPRECSDLVAKHFGNYGPMTITTTGFSVNGQAIDSQVNTLFTGTMLIYPTAVKRLDLVKQSKGRQKEMFPFTDGGVKLVKAEAATESFGNLGLMPSAPVYFVTPEAHTPDSLFDATVGIGLLNRSAVTFDFKAMKIWIEQ